MIFERFDKSRFYFKMFLILFNLDNAKSYIIKLFRYNYKRRAPNKEVVFVSYLLKYVLLLRVHLNIAQNLIFSTSFLKFELIIIF